MKYFFCLALLAAFSGCISYSSKLDPLASKNDSSINKPQLTYKPGLGEFMLGIQVHHTKIFFAGQAQNWDLAQFELDEMHELIEDIRKFNADRPEVKSLGMIDSPLDSIAAAIKTHDAQFFSRSYAVLTNTCNLCHKATGHGFNVIKTPETNPFPDQVFGTSK